MIRAIVFDVGRVFVRLNPRPILELMRERAADCRDLKSLIAQIELDEHECGRVSGAGLIERMRALAQLPVTSAELEAKWLDMFELEPDMVELAQRLAARYRVYLLSNVGDLHWQHLCRQYELHRLGHDALPSFVAGVMKPDAAIYRQAEQRFALEPGATVFIDDRSENVDAARALGWHGIVHASYADTRTRLRALGVED